MSIALDAASVRDEIEYMVDIEAITPAAAERLVKLDDSVIDAALDRAAGNRFWDAYDATRYEAIVALSEATED